MFNISSTTANNNKFKALSENSTAQLSLIILFTLSLFVVLCIIEDAHFFFENISLDNYVLNLVLALAASSPLLFLFSIRKIIILRKQVEINEKIKKESRKTRYDMLEAMDTLPDMLFCLIDKKKRIYWANKAILKFDIEAIGKSVEQIFFPEESLLSQSTLVHKTFENHTTESVVKYYPANSFFKNEKYIEHRCIPFSGASQKIETVLLVSQDVTIRTQLEDSRGKLVTVVEASDDAIFVVDKNGILHSWNAGAEKMFGYKSEQIVGQPITILDHYIYFETLISTVYEQKSIQQKGIQHIEIVPLNKNGKKYFVSFSIYPFFDETGNILGTSTIVRDKTDAVLAERALVENEKRMRKLALHIDAVREEERKQIAFAIHDELGYALSAIKLDITWLQKKLDTPENNIDIRFRETLKLIDTAIQKVKSISLDLRPSILDHFGLGAAIEWQSGEFQRRMAIRCRVSIVPKDFNVSEKYRTPIFRIFQEALTNITRYAKASRVDVNVNYNESTRIFKMEVIDNGVGIPIEKINNHSSFGLLGIREKAASIGGTATISRNDNSEGTRVYLELKLPNSEQITQQF